MSDCGDVRKVFVPDSKSKTEEGTTTPIKGVLISDVAAEKIKLFVTQDNKSLSEYGLWIGVKNDGCSGHSYDMSIKAISESTSKKDKLFTHENGATVMVDLTSYFFVTGSILGYTEALTGSGFTLNNPNIKKSCSCGSSFSV